MQQGGPYSSPLLNDLHAHFPAFLYMPERFNTVRDIFRYISEQMSERFDIYSSWRNYHRRMTPPQQYHQYNYRPRYQQQQQQPQVYVPPTPVPASTTQAEMDQFTALLLRTLVGGNTTTVNPNLFWEPVVVAPTALQISTASTTYMAPTALDTPCAICQDTIAEGAHVRKLSHCNHFFHKDCIDSWFQRDTHCPVCRHDIRSRRTVS